jgi:hypothetical protein
MPFPTGSFSTITAKYDISDFLRILDVSSHLSYSPDLHVATPSCSMKAQSVALAGSILGGVFLGLAIAFGTFLVYFRHLRPPGEERAYDSPARQLW